MGENNLSDRDMLIRGEAQLQESIRNIADIKNRLEIIFSKIESDSKLIYANSLDINITKESMKLQLEELKKKIEALENITDQVKDIKNELSVEVTNVKTSLSTEVATVKTDLEKDLAEESKSRSIFQETISTSFQTTKVVVGIFIVLIGLTATILSILWYIKDIK